MLPRKAFLVLALATITSISSGCAGSGTAYKSNPKKSQAYNVTKAAGAKYLKDTLPSKKRIGKINYEGNSTGIGEFIGVTMLAGFSTSIPFLFIGEKASKELWPALIGWMPSEMAKNEEEAMKKYRDIFETAAIKAIQETTWPDGIHMQIENHKMIVDYKINDREGTCEESLPTSGDGYLKIRKVIVCEEGNQNENCGKVTMEYSKPKTHVIKKELTPDFIDSGSKESWATTNNKNVLGLTISTGFVRCGNNDEKKTPIIIPTYNYYKNLSKNLPSWMYMYIAPPKKSPVLRNHSIKAFGTLAQKNDGNFGFITSPVVLHQGKEMYFIVD
jgi:hypothetical protein